MLKMLNNLNIKFEYKILQNYYSLKTKCDIIKTFILFNYLVWNNDNLYHKACALGQDKYKVLEKKVLEEKKPTI